MKPTRKRIQSAILDIVKPLDKSWPVVIGSGTGLANIETGTKGLIYVTHEISGVIEQVWNTRLPNKSGLHVTIGEDPQNPGVVQVLRERIPNGGHNFGIGGGGGNGNNPLPEVGAHHETHELYGTDTIKVSGGMITPLNVLPIKGTFIVIVYPAVILTLLWTDVPTQNVDLSSLIPTSGAKWVLLQSDSTGVVTTIEASFTAKADLLISAIPLPDADSYPICAVRLYTGQTALSRTGTQNDFVDLRWGNGYLGAGGGSSGAMLKSIYDTNDNGRVDQTEIADPNRVVLSAPTTGALTSDASFYFDHTLGIVYLGGASGNSGQSTNTVLNFLAKANDTQVLQTMWAWGASSTTNPAIVGYRSRGTAASPSALMSGDRLWNIAALGHDGVGWVGSVARMLLVATENWSATNHGASIFFEGTPNASTTRREFGKVTELGFDVPTGAFYNVNGVPIPTLTDGDKGDITISASGATFTIDDGAVTLAKQADMATASLVYRKTAGAGAPEVNTLATLKTDLGLAGTNSGDVTLASPDSGLSLTGQVIALGSPSTITENSTNAVTTNTHSHEIERSHIQPFMLMGA